MCGQQERSKRMNARRASKSTTNKQAFIKSAFVDDKLAGVILFGDTRDKQRLLDSLLKQRDISIAKKQIIEPETSGPLFESMPSSETICQCNTVTKGAIEDAVHTNSLTTVEEVKHCTKATGPAEDANRSLKTF